MTEDTSQDDPLRRQAARLHADLTAAVQADPRSKEALGDTLQHVERLIEGPLPHESLTERLERVAVQFEAEHPALAAGARRLIDLLGEAGI